MIGRIFGTIGAIQDQIDLIDQLKIPEDAKIKLRIGVFNQYTSFKLAQRALALIITLTYVLAIVLALVYQYKGLDYKGILEIAAAFEIGFVMLIIAGFYFGGGAIESLKDKTIKYKEN